MNQQRRRIIKAALALGVVSSSTAFYLLKQNKNEQTAFQDLMEGLVIPPAFQELSIQFPNAEQLIADMHSSEEQNGDTLVTILKSLISRDYQQSNWIQVNQWLLSHTECVLAAAVIQIKGVTNAIEDEQTFENAPVEPFLKVNKWGPQETYKGVKFNEQPDGHCGIWANIENMPDGLRVFIGGKERHIFPNEKGFTSGIYDEVDAFINTVGPSDIVIYDEINHRKQVIGTFNVLPPFDFYQYPNGKPSTVFGPIENWGPKKASIGDVFNKQPNGYAAFWFRLNSMSNQVQMIFNHETFHATVRKGLITSSFPAQYLPIQPGMYPLELKDMVTQEQIMVGEIEVMAQK